MAQVGPATAQPGKTRNDGAKNAIAGNYIVVYKDTAVSKKAVGATTARLAAKHNASVGFRYFSALRGFSARAAALILSATTTATPAGVWSTMLANSTPNKATNPLSGSPNRLLGAATPTPPPPNSWTIDL